MSKQFTDKEILDKYNEIKIKIATIGNTTKQDFKRFQEELKGLPTEYVTELGIDIDNFTAEKYLPHLYIEPFDGDAYEEERQAALVVMNKITRLKEELKNKAAEKMGMI